MPVHFFLVRLIKLAHVEHEVFAALRLDNWHQIIVFEELFRGTIDGCLRLSKSAHKWRTTLREERESIPEPLRAHLSERNLVVEW